MPDTERQRMALEDAVGLLESVRSGLAEIENPSFDEKRMEGYLVAALSAARSALSIPAGREDPAGLTDPDR